MLSKVRKAIEKFNMLDKTECVTVALSGGADSVALLYALKMLDYNIRALHVNHQLRGEESDRDEAFVRALCAKENIPLEVHRADVEGEAKKRSLGLEECGREIRYKLLKKSAEKHGGKIATAHTLSDNTETVLLNMTRGCALAGVTGIPPVRDNIIRPLIFSSREDIEKFCKENGLEYVTDSSNLSDDYSRNRVRHHTVPSLKSVNPAFEQSVGRMTELLSEDEDYINSAVREAQKLRRSSGYSLDDLKKLHKAILSRLIISEYRNASREMCSYLHVQRVSELIERGHGREELPNNIFAVIRKGVLIFEKNTEECDEFSIDAKVPCRVDVCGKSIVLEKVDRYTYDELKKNDRYLFKNAFDYDIMFPNLAIRNRRSGDKLRQAGRGVTKELRRLMNEKGIPPQERGSLVVLSDEKGVIWAEGFGTDENRAVTEKTMNVVVIKVESGN